MNFFVALVLAVLLASPAASAKDLFGFRLLDLDGIPVRWVEEGSGPLTVTYAFVDRPMRFVEARNCEGMAPMDSLLAHSKISQSLFRQEVRAAFEMWQQAANITFRETADTATSGILIGAQHQADGWAFTNVMQRPNQPGKIARSLICLNSDQRWKVGFDGNLAAYDLRYTIAHEIGHAIGLDHPAPTGQLMAYRYEEQFSALQPGDISGAVELYGSKRTDDLVPAPVDRAETHRVGSTRTLATVICTAIGRAVGC